MAVLKDQPIQGFLWTEGLRVHPKDRIRIIGYI